MNDQEPPPFRIEDTLADAIADAWGDLSSKAAGEADEETRKNEELILFWREKLAQILQGKPL
jgi:hypothetical protein